MIEHKVNDQWIETLKDGKRHMIKLVKHVLRCRVCIYHNGFGCELPSTFTKGCPFPGTEIVAIDLGIVDENDILHCPFCGGKMEVLDKFYAFDGFTVRCKVCSCGTDCYMTKDKALEAANRRV